MDTQWFKERIREKGLNTQDIAEAIGRDRAVVSRILNGHQPLKPEHAERFSQLLDQPLEAIISHAGMFANETGQGQALSLTDGDVTPFKGASGSLHDRIAKVFGQKPGIDMWTVATRALELMGYLPGDHILVDTSQKQARPGDVVIAQVYDFQRGGTTTVLRRFEPPVLVAATTERTDWGVYVVDNNAVSIMGQVSAQWRAS